MADLPTRSEHEEKLAAALAVAWDRWNSRAARGGRLSWDELRDRIATDPAILGEMADTFLDAAKHQHEEAGILFDEAQLAAAALQWSRLYVPTLAGEIAGTSRASVELAMVSGDNMADILSRVHSPDRAITIAITETTRAITEAGWAVAGMLVLVDGQPAREPVWRTERDGRVCPTCAPLDGTRRDVWGNQFPAGPGAHPRCRCRLEWLEVS